MFEADAFPQISPCCHLSSLVDTSAQLAHSFFKSAELSAVSLYKCSGLSKITNEPVAEATNSEPEVAFASRWTNLLPD